MWKSLVLSVTEATLSAEQLAAGLIVGDPMFQVFWQLRGLHLQGDRKLRLQRSRPAPLRTEREAQKRGKQPSWLPSASGPTALSHPLLSDLAGTTPTN